MNSKYNQSVQIWLTEISLGTPELGGQQKQDFYMHAIMNKNNIHSTFCYGENDITHRC